MAGKTNTEKTDELDRLVTSLTGRVDVIQRDIAELPALFTRAAVLEQQVVDLNKKLEALTARLWQIGIPLVVGLSVALLTAILRR